MEFIKGQLVFLTRAADVWLRDRRSDTSGIFFMGRIAQIDRVLDWDSEEGKEVHKTRQESGKWLHVINPLDYKYKLRVAFPEYPRTKEEFGLVLEDWVPVKYQPVGSKTLLPLFLPLHNEIIELVTNGNQGNVQPQSNSGSSTQETVGEPDRGVTVPTKPRPVRKGRAKV